MTVADNKPAFRLTDLYWLIAIAATMATSGLWEWLSPRPEIGKVAVFWIPSAVLLVALVRNWGRTLFCLLAIAVFLGFGGYSSFEQNTEFGTLSLLTADIIEVLMITVCLTRWSGSRFQFNSTLSVAVYGASIIGACFLSSFIAAGVSQTQFGDMPIVEAAPLQVGVAWFTSNVATYFLVATPLFALTSRDVDTVFAGLKRTPWPTFVAAIMVAGLTFIGYFLPQWIATRTGLALGTGGLTLIAFPLATYLAVRRGTTVASLIGAAIGIPTIYATIAGIGPYGKGNIQANVFDMQATLIVTMFTLLLVGAMSEQLRERSRALERSLEDAIKLRDGGT
jgi:hypothetical protein